MILVVEKSKLAGQVLIPASKSHTIRAVAIGSLASGTSRIANPLSASDTLAAVEVYKGFGASISRQQGATRGHGDTETGRPGDGAIRSPVSSIEQRAASIESVKSEMDEWIINGIGGVPAAPKDTLDVGNSGTTLYIAMGTAALANGRSVLTGDDQIQSRPAGPLLDALNGLGARASSASGDGRPPVVIEGPIRGGSIRLDGSKTSQYLTSLLINCPLVPRTAGLAAGNSEILVSNAVEKPFIQMTLGWLDEQGITYEREGFERFYIPGGQSYRAFEKSMPGDFSSAAFFLCAAAITGSELFLLGLDMNDSQGDKAIVDMLRAMGADIEQLPDGLKASGGKLTAGEFDLGGTPDALPIMAVTACFAEGTTRLVNVAQARLKETDRIKVMREELTKMGGKIKELPDGLEIEGTALHSAKVCGHADHRVVMALAVAGLACDGRTEIDTAESVSVTFPNFVELMQSAGADMRV